MKKLTSLLLAGTLLTGCATSKLENKTELEPTKKQGFVYWSDSLAKGWIPGYGIIRDYLEYRTDKNKLKEEQNKAYK